MHVWSAAQDTVRHARRSAHDAFATIQDQQHAPFAQRGDNAPRRIGREVIQSEREGSGSGNRVIAVESGEIDPLNAVGIRATDGIGHRAGDGSFPYAAGSDDADQALLRQLRLDSGDDFVAPMRPPQMDWP